MPAIESQWKSLHSRALPSQPSDVIGHSRAADLLEPVLEATDSLSAVLRLTKLVEEFGAVGGI